MQVDILQKELFPVIDRTPIAAAKNSRITIHPEPAQLIELTPETGQKAPGAFKTINEAATLLGVPQHVLRFWESKFSQIKPLKLNGGRRYYRPEDMDVLTNIQHLLYKQGYTIKGAKKALSTKAPPKAESKPQPAAKAPVDDRQRKQLMALRLELIGLQAKLKPYI